MWGCVVLLWCRCSNFAPVLFKRCCAGLAAAPRVQAATSCAAKHLAAYLR